MVNGSRPTQLYLNGSVHSSAFHTPQSHTARTVGTNHVSTPTLLQRQTTSMYSTCSTETPILVCAKKATPLAGAWSEEPWTPSHLAPRATLADLLEANMTGDDCDGDVEDDVEGDLQLKDCDQETTASFAETAVFSDKQRQASSQCTAAPVAAVVNKCNGDSPTTQHVSVVYRHEPYAFAAPRREIFRCQCDACFEADADCTGHDFLTYGSSAQPPRQRHADADDFAAAGPYHRHAHDDHDGGMPSFDESPSYGSYEAAFYGEAVAPASQQHHDVHRLPPREEGFHGSMPHSAAAPLSTFMPPPPPPKITRGVIAESAEPTLDVDAAFYHIAMRWYGKAVKVQANFVSIDELCPEPNRNGQSFPEWVEEVGKWWLVHFEHLQKKTSLSSGLLRTAIAPAGGASRFGPAGFETHASIAATYAAHKLALKTGPRRALGSSGLTAEMLESHTESAPKQAMLPTPRSKQPGPATADLPW